MYSYIDSLINPSHIEIEKAMDSYQRLRQDAINDASFTCDEMLSKNYGIEDVLFYYKTALCTVARVIPSVRKEKILLTIMEEIINESFQYGHKEIEKRVRFLLSKAKEFVETQKDETKIDH